MNKKVLYAGVLMLLVIMGAGIYVAYTNRQTVVTSNESTSSQQDTNALPTEQKNTDGGNYINLATYNEDTSNYTNDKVVYFFHASWCPICQSIDKAISADTSKIPNGVTIVKTDFDSNTDLRKKYGVTTQYTFVQVDNTGTEISQWTATSLDRAIAGIQ